MKFKVLSMVFNGCSRMVSIGNENFKVILTKWFRLDI
jgi:hypothetical protein